MMKDVCLACIGFILQTMIFLAAGRLVFQGSEINGRYFPAADPGISGVLCGI